VRRVLSFLFLFAILLSGQDPDDWHQAFPAFRIAGNIYYVGTGDLASYLIATPAGHILINTDYEQDVPLIRSSVEKLGFKFADIKIVLLSHAHDDHVAGTAAVKMQTGAQLMVMDGDVAAMESGTTDFQPSDQHWKPVKVDRVLQDGDYVEIGGTRLLAHLTAGHTKGCTTWTSEVQDGRRTLHVVIECSANVIPAYKLLNDPKYPHIADDFEKTFRTLRGLPCDVFLSAHGNSFDLKGKYARLKTNTENPFIDPAGYKTYVAEHENSFRRELDRQRAKLARNRDIISTRLYAFASTIETWPMVSRHAFGGRVVRYMF
jgi:metallo-beta-lactamase class B